MNVSREDQFKWFILCLKATSPKSLELLKFHNDNGIQKILEPSDPIVSPQLNMVNTIRLRSDISIGVDASEPVEDSILIWWSSSILALNLQALFP